MKPVQYAHRDVQTALIPTALIQAPRGPEPPIPRRGRRPVDGTYSIDVVTSSGRTAWVEFRIRFDWVEIWHHQQRTGFFEREQLRHWLLNPGAPISSEDVRLSLDWMVDASGRVALTLPDVSLWTLSPQSLEGLSARL